MSTDNAPQEWTVSQLKTLEILKEGQNMIVAFLVNDKVIVQNVWSIQHLGGKFEQCNTRQDFLNVLKEVKPMHVPSTQITNVMHTMPKSGSIAAYSDHTSWKEWIPGTVVKVFMSAPTVNPPNATQNAPRVSLQSAKVGIPTKPQELQKESCKMIFGYLQKTNYRWIQKTEAKVPSKPASRNNCITRMYCGIPNCNHAGTRYVTKPKKYGEPGNEKPTSMIYHLHDKHYPIFIHLYVCKDIFYNILQYYTIFVRYNKKIQIAPKADDDPKEYSNELQQEEVKMFGSPQKLSNSYHVRYNRNRKSVPDPQKRNSRKRKLDQKTRSVTTNATQSQAVTSTGQVLPNKKRRLRMF